MIYSLPGWVRETMMTLDQGVCILVRGKMSRVLHRAPADRVETWLNNTEEGMGSVDMAEPAPLTSPDGTREAALDAT